MQKAPIRSGAAERAAGEELSGDPGLGLHSLFTLVADAVFPGPGLDPLLPLDARALAVRLFVLFCIEWPIRFALRRRDSGRIRCDRCLRVWNALRLRSCACSFR